MVPGGFAWFRVVSCFSTYAYFIRTIVFETMCIKISNPTTLHISASLFDRFIPPKVISAHDLTACQFTLIFNQDDNNISILFEMT